MSVSEPAPSNFIRHIVEEDLRSGRHQQVVTRFPPEPNGYLHIGHAKAICISFGLPAAYGGRCHLRMDDTNPLKEDESYVSQIKRDIQWLGFDWGEHFFHASDYFDQLHAWAVLLIEKGLAYVDEQTDEQIRANRGTVETPGTPSPWRDRPIAESLTQFAKMTAGALPDGAMVLRAKIDMGHANMKLRDPLMYRIRNTSHHNTGDKWHIYPFYDWAHGQSDAIEGITHSLCSLEFDVNRELYDWFLDNLPVPHRPHQYEFARLRLAYTMMSKRNLLALVQEGAVDGWDDPRMPTLAGMRRRGVTPEAIRNFIEGVGVAKAGSLVDPVLLDNAIRDDLNDKAPRLLAVFDPLPLDVTYKDGPVSFDASLWPRDIDKEGTRPLVFDGQVWIERSDFEVTPSKGYKRFAPGRAVRLRHGPVVRVTGHETDADGNVTKVLAEHLPEGSAGVKVWATVHWVGRAQAVPFEAHLVERLFNDPEPGKDAEFRTQLNDKSLEVASAVAEPHLRTLSGGMHVQFERVGYFYTDPERWDATKPVLTRVVPLKDSWAKQEAAPEPVAAPTSAEPVQTTKTVRTLGPVGLALAANGLSDDEAAVLEADAGLRAWFEAAVVAAGGAHSGTHKAVGSWVVNDLPRVAREHGGLAGLPFRAEALGALVAMTESGTVTQAIARQVLVVMAESGGEPAAIVAERGWTPLTDDGAIEGVIAEVCRTFPDRVTAYKGGRTGLFGFFVGQVMQRTEGRADPQQITRLLQAALS